MKVERSRKDLEEFERRRKDWKLKEEEKIGLVERRRNIGLVERRRKVGLVERRRREVGT